MDTEPKPALSRRPWRPAPGPLLIAVVALLHAGALFSSFSWDDAFVLLQNAYVRSFDVAGIWTERVWAGAGNPAPYWRPLSSLSFAAQHALTGLEPWPLHLVNVLLHLAATGLVFAAARRVTGSPWAAFAGAALFGLHPVQVEVVSGIANRGDALAAVFAMWALLLHLRPDAPRSGTTLLAGLALAGACLSKEIGIAVLAPLLAWDWTVRCRRSWRSLAGALRGPLGVAWGGFGLVSIAYLAAHRAVAGPLQSAAPDFLRNPITAAPFWTQKLLALSVLGRAIRLLAWPAELSADYSYRTLEIDPARATPDAALGAAVVLLLGFVALRAARRAPIVTAGLALAGAAWLPVSNLPFSIEVMMAERFLYLPLAGMGLALAGGLASARATTRPRSLRALTAVGALACAALGLRTAVRARDWRDQRALTASAVSTYPANVRMQLAWAQLLEAGGDHAAADDAYGRAIEVWPQFAAAWTERAAVLRNLGRRDEALAAASRAVDLDPDDVVCWANLAIELERAGALSDALAVLRAGAARLPGNPYLRQHAAQLEARLRAGNGAPPSAVR